MIRIGLNWSGLIATAGLLWASAPTPTFAQELLVISSNTNSVRRYDARDGAYLGDFIAPGAGGVSAPAGLAFGPGGDLFVASFLTNKVGRYDGRTGTYLGDFVTPGSGGLDGPNSLAFGPNGDLFVGTRFGGTPSFPGSVKRYDGQTGAFLGDFVPPGTGGLDVPTELLFEPGGDLLVPNFGFRNVLRFDGQTGAFEGEFIPSGSGGLSGPGGIAYGPDGNLYVTSSDDVLRYDGVTGSFIDVFTESPGRFILPIDLAFGPDGDLYVSNFVSNDVRRYNGVTGALETILIPEGSGLDAPFSLAFRPTIVPEPGGVAFVAVLAACGGLFLRRRASVQRRRRSWIENKKPASAAQQRTF